jgi:hypothetical protein
MLGALLGRAPFATSATRRQGRARFKPRGAASRLDRTDRASTSNRSWRSRLYGGGGLVRRAARDCRRRSIHFCPRNVGARPLPSQSHLLLVDETAMQLRSRRRACDPCRSDRPVARGLATLSAPPLVESPLDGDKDRPIFDRFVTRKRGALAMNIVRIRRSLLLLVAAWGLRPPCMRRVATQARHRHKIETVSSPASTSSCCGPRYPTPRRKPWPLQARSAAPCSMSTPTR